MSRRTILIVEDEAACASMLEIALEALPEIAVARAASAEAALDALARTDVAAVISDLQLPGISGIELIAGAGGVPVVIVSASVAAGVKEAALRAGAAAFFPKPFSPAVVCEKIRELLKESKND
jgi:DNA-binding response OmpR family regulator